MIIPRRKLDDSTSSIRRDGCSERQQSVSSSSRGQGTRGAREYSKEEKMIYFFRTRYEEKMLQLQEQEERISGIEAVLYKEKQKYDKIHQDKIKCYDALKEMRSQ